MKLNKFFEKDPKKINQKKKKKYLKKKLNTITKNI